MLMVFAKNQTLVDSASGGATIFTNAVSVGDNNQASSVTVISKIFNPGNGLSWTMQVSNDGVNWVSQGPACSNQTSAGTTFNAPLAISAMYARLSITFQSSAAIGAVTFDVQVHFSRTI